MALLSYERKYRVRGDLTGDNSDIVSPLLADRSLLRDRLLAAVAAVQDLGEVDGTRLAMLGYCFGGLCALDLARAAPPELRCAISVHGLLSPPDFDVTGPLPARLLILHGWEDPFVPPADVIAGLKAFTDLGATWELHAYGHAIHAFTFAGAHFPERGIAHDPLADRRSWRATCEFLSECLSVPAATS